MEKSSRYIFCHDGHAGSLVMLDDPNKIVTNMFERPSQTFVIWVEAHQDQPFTQKLTRFEKLIQMKIELFKDFTVLRTAIEQEKVEGEFVLVCAHSKINQAKNIAQDHQASVKAVACYDCKKDFQQTVDCYGQPKQFIGVRDEFKLVEICNRFKQTKSDFKQLFNFVSLVNSGWQSTVQVRTMTAMIQQKISPQTRKLVVDRLQDLVVKVEAVNLQFKQNSTKIKEFIKELGQTQLDVKRSIQWYTCETPIYKLLNNLLRSSNHPSQVYYIQPFFKDLFNSIRKIYEGHQIKGEWKSFSCYRGGKISEEELQQLENSINGILQSLGFISTSVEKQEAMKYVDNVLFEIIISDDLTDPQNNYGYAFLGAHSHFVVEREVLFNPLNSFKILSIQSKNQLGKEFHHIKLEFGILAKMLNFKPQQLNFDQRMHFRLAQELGSTKLTYKMQGQVLNNYHQSLSGCKQYWIMYNKLAKEPNQIIKGLNHLGQCQKNTKNFKAALDLLIKCEQMMLKNGGKHKNYLDVLNNISLIYKELKEQDKSWKYRQLYTKKFAQSGDKNPARFVNKIGLLRYQQGHYLGAIEFFQIGFKLGRDTSDQHLTASINLAKCYQKLGEYALALDLFQKAQKTILFIFGESSNYYTMILEQLRDLHQLLNNTEQFLRYSNQLVRISESSPHQSYGYLQAWARIAQFYFHNQKTFKSIEYSERRMKNFITIFGPLNRVYFLTLERILILYEMVGDSKKIREVQQEYANVRARLMKKQKGSAETNFGRQQEQKQVREFYEARFSANRQSVESSHESFLESLMELASVYKSQGLFEDCILCYEKYLRIMQKEGRQKSIENISALSTLFQIYMEKNQNRKALEFLQKGLMLVQNYPNHPNFLEVKCNEAEFDLKRGEIEKALNSYLRCAQDLRKKGGYDKVNQADLLNIICRIYQSFGLLEEAKKTCYQQLQLRKQNSGVRNLRFMLNLQRLSKIQENQGETANAIYYKDKVVKLAKSFMQKNYKNKKSIQYVIYELQKLYQKYMKPKKKRSLSTLDFATLEM